MLLQSIHILANLILKETVPPQPRTSPHVTWLVAWAAWRHFRPCLVPSWCGTNGVNRGHCRGSGISSSQRAAFL